MLNSNSQYQLLVDIWDASILIHGYLDAGDNKQFILYLLFYKHLYAIYDEDTAESFEIFGYANR